MVMTKEEFDDYLLDMKTNGLIFEPRPNVIQKV